MKIAVIVTTYNRPDALDAVLRGYLCQSDADFEILVADDGSTEETKDLVAKHGAASRVRIKHVWQEDLGFRAARIRNLAIAATDSPYVIFTDGDCVPPGHFVASHRKLLEASHFLAGNRILLTESFTESVLSNHIPIHEWGMTEWAAARLQGNINRLLPLVHLPDCCRKTTPNKWAGAKTCNLSAFREDLVEINGFDEAYTGWGLEDSDMVIRLIRAGIKYKSAKFACPVFHLWHKDNDRSRLDENSKRLESILGDIRIRASLGLDQYL